MPLTRRGHFRVDPLQIRTGDPFGFFEANAAVGHGLTLVVYPRLERIPRWRLRAVSLEGSRSTPVRTQQTTPLATSIRPYAPGDAFNRIHWPSTARTGEIQVKEFDLEQTADVWLFVDLERRVQCGSGDDSSVEVAVRVAAAVAERALSENRAVGLTTTGAHIIHLSPDRGPRQRQKILNLLAAVDGDGSTPLVEALVAGLPLLRRGMSAVIVTPAAETAWVRPLATLGPRGIGVQVMFMDPHGFMRHEVVAAGRSMNEPDIAAERSPRSTRGRAGFTVRCRVRRSGVRDPARGAAGRGSGRMSANSTPFEHRPAGPADVVRQLALAPAEGWSSVLLLALMAALVGLSIDDAHWVLGSRTLTNFLPWAGVLGVTWGFVAAKAGAGRLLAYLGGAVIAAAYLTLVVGAQLAPGASIGGVFQATADSVVGAYIDLLVRGRATTVEVGHFLLVLGIICWEPANSPRTPPMPTGAPSRLSSCRARCCWPTWR